MRRKIEAYRPNIVPIRFANTMPELPVSDAVQAFYTDASSILLAPPNAKAVLRANGLRRSAYLEFLRASASKSSKQWGEAIRKEREHVFGLPNWNEPERIAWQWIQRSISSMTAYPLGKQADELQLPNTNVLSDLMPFDGKQHAALVVPCERGHVVFLVMELRTRAYCGLEEFAGETGWQVDTRAKSIIAVGARGSVQRSTLQALKQWWRRDLTGQSGRGRPVGQMTQGADKLINAYISARRRYPNDRVTKDRMAEEFCKLYIDSNIENSNTQHTYLERAFKAAGISGVRELRSFLEAIEEHNGVFVAEIEV